jgi:uncharacterized protein DUF6283
MRGLSGVSRADGAAQTDNRGVPQGSGPATRCVRQPCISCPWRVGSRASDIPNFSMKLAEGLVGTTDTEFGAPMFACHQSRDGAEIVCAGWLARYGWDSIGVRLGLCAGAFHRDQLEPGEDWPELYPDFEAMLDNLRATHDEQPLSDHHPGGLHD